MKTAKTQTLFVFGHRLPLLQSQSHRHIDINRIRKGKKVTSDTSSRKLITSSFSTRKINAYSSSTHGLTSSKTCFPIASTTDIFAQPSASNISTSFLSKPSYSPKLFFFNSKTKKLAERRKSSLNPHSHLVQKISALPLV